MPSSRKRRTSLPELEIELLWGAWSELGGSGWGRTHRDWVVDPEPLIVRTAEVADSDPGLRDEALDWCIHYWRYVSRVRLRGLLRGRTDEAAEAWGWFAATVNKHSTARWPGSTDEISYKITGRSSLTTMKQPSRAWLRMRAAFGVGARTEILRYFLSGPSLGSTTAIAEWVGYAKSNVVNECDALEKAGVLRRRHIGNRLLLAGPPGGAAELRRRHRSAPTVLGSTARCDICSCRPGAGRGDASESCVDGRIAPGERSDRRSP